jgi:hypothetical protein
MYTLSTLTPRHSNKALKQYSRHQRFDKKLINIYQRVHIQTKTYLQEGAKWCVRAMRKDCAPTKTNKQNQHNTYKNTAEYLKRQLATSMTILLTKQ